MPSFIEIRFPTDIAYGSQGGPEFLTEVVELGGGQEKRNQVWELPRERWDVAYGVTTKEKMVVLRDFFYAVKGRATGFRFKNHDDYQGVNEQLGTGNGVVQTFQCRRVYTFNAAVFYRPVKKLVAVSQVRVNGIVQNPSTYTVNVNTGEITFYSAPTGPIDASFTFDVPVRFDVDFLPMRLDSYLSRSASVPLIELKL